MIFLQLLFLAHLNVHASDIIYLKGTCSAGKSTLMRSLASQSEDLAIVDEDAIMHRSYVEAVSSRYPEAFDVIERVIAKENLYHALREKDVLFISSASPEACDEAMSALKMIQDELNQDLPWRKMVSQGIDEEVMRNIHEALKREKTVLLDSWYITPQNLISEFPEAKLIKLLLYRPLSAAYEQFLKRNKDAHHARNLSEKRYMRQLIGSFVSLYQISKEPSHPIEKITKNELDIVLTKMADHLKGDIPYKKSVFTFEEISKRYFLELKEGFLHPFRNSDECLYLEPRESYDMIIKDANHCLLSDLQKL